MWSCNLDASWNFWQKTAYQINQLNQILYKPNERFNISIDWEKKDISKKMAKLSSSILGLVLGAVLCVIQLSPGAEGHGYLAEPHGRASAWRSVSNTDICLNLMEELQLGQYQTRISVWTWWKSFSLVSIKHGYLSKSYGRAFAWRYVLKMNICLNICLNFCMEVSITHGYLLDRFSLSR